MGKSYNCPYREMPATSNWRKAIEAVKANDVDPVVSVKFGLESSEKIATAGSCFAQHVARYLKQEGGSYFVTEPGNRVLGSEILEEFNYGTFSARYGNIYTTRQLLQLIKRAYGEFVPNDDVWVTEDGFVDPFRPFIQPGGFGSLREYRLDRERHFAAVRSLFEEMDVFVFTLGLTECWESTVDGAVYPICPGCGVGNFDPTLHRFKNLNFSETYADLQSALSRLFDINPNLKVILTVSPVPLVATAEPRHVLSSTTYSKSVLRAVAGEIAEKDQRIDYFPSYEIITGNYSRGGYYEKDLRSVTEPGVNHVMRTLFAHYYGREIASYRPSHKQAVASNDRGPKVNVVETASSKAARVVCDEENLETAMS